MLDLSKYDGSAGFLVDTNTWIDCMDPGSPWHEWAVDQLQSCSEQAPVHVNLVIYAELLIPGPDMSALDAMLDVYDTLRSLLPWTCAGLAAQAYLNYRRGGRGTARTAAGRLHRCSCGGCKLECAQPGCEAVSQLLSALALYWARREGLKAF